MSKCVHGRPCVHFVLRVTSSSGHYVTVENRRVGHRLVCQLHAIRYHRELGSQGGEIVWKGGGVTWPRGVCDMMCRTWTVLCSFLGGSDGEIPDELRERVSLTLLAVVAMEALCQMCEWVSFFPHSCVLVLKCDGWGGSAEPGHSSFHHMNPEDNTTFVYLWCCVVCICCSRGSLVSPHREGIHWEAIDWMDNAECLDLIEKVAF